MPGIIALCLPFIPESPRWLLQHRTEDSARKALRRLRPYSESGEKVEEELEAMKRMMESEEVAAKDTEIIALWKNSVERRRTLLAIGAHLLLHRGSDRLPFRRHLHHAGTGAFVLIINSAIITRYGRRRVFLGWGMLFCGASQLVMAAVYTKFPMTTLAGKVTVGCTIFNLIFYNGMVSTYALVSGGELPSQRLRSYTLGIATSVGFLLGWVVGFTAPYFINPASLGWGPKYGYIWAASSVIGAAWVWLFLPEVKGRTFEEIDEMTSGEEIQRDGNIFKTSRTPSPTAGSPSPSVSSGVLISYSDGDSTSSFPVADNQSQGLAEQVATMRLSEDIPLPSTEGGSSDSLLGGANILRGTTHSRTPSLSLTPPVDEGMGGGPASRRATGSIDDRLGMSEVATAIERIAIGSDNPGVSLRPESPAASNDSSHRRASRRRSSSRINMPPHDVVDEELPHDRFHEPTFQQAFLDAKRSVSKLTDVLSSSSIHNEPDSTMRRLHEEADKLAGFQCPSTRTVGFVGDSGVGKSSLLNSLLDFRGLARTSNSGAACTCVVTEFHFHNSNDFAIDVEWFSLDDIAAQLTELLQSYRHYHLHSAEMERQEREDLEDRANVARDTFRAMFRGRLGNEQFLMQSPEAAVMQTLQSWAAEFGTSSAGGRETQRTIEDCSALLMRLTSEENSTQEPAKWPYIRKIKVFINAHILSKGLVLVDLPGLRDLNSARRNITERYLLQCDEIFAVCNIGRAMTDASVVSIFDLARQARMSNVGIICTKSDDIQAEEAKRDWRDKARRIQQFMDVISKDQLEVEMIQADLDDFADDGYLSDGEVEELREFNRRSTQAKQETPGPAPIRVGGPSFNERSYFSAQAYNSGRLKKYLIDTRNAAVKQTLHSAYHDKVPGNALKVFCASNTEYWEHRDLPKDVALPHLKLSGILTIRKHCISMVADRQLRIATKYIQDDIPALLGDVDFTIARSFKEKFSARIYSTSFSAFCRNFGDHYTKVAGRHNWNEEAIEKMARDLATPWQHLKSTLQHDLEGNRNQIQEIMDWSIEYLDTELQNSSESASTLSRAMMSRSHLLLADVEQACEKFETDLNMLRTLALSGIRTSLIGQLMENSYRGCNAEGGGGSDARRKAIIKRKLNDEATFESLQRDFKNSFRTQAESLQTDIQTAIATHLAVIKNTLDIVRNENIALESEREPEFRGRVEREARIVKDEISRIQNAIST
ncbi:hypothetical protein G7Y89_g12058 [Cudoniella acicularis]|uniref:Major facilitator superfamily (MFS) profile domain-containing protein n=1 Tax=Cudoniella acicularis TaxID=354080 RepID=A0A8H4R9T8_9HELO|nr:hypothetical protein G7Y89_g12058 [Cudoniella acicularis]